MLAREWHPVKNGALTPKDIARASGRSVWWRCIQGHDWEAPVYSRTIGGNGCPYCSNKKVSRDNSLRTRNPKLAREWDRDRNGELTPAGVTPGSKRRVWWRCRAGHEWQAPVHERSSGRGCPYCAHRRLAPDNNLAALKPELAAEWHPTRNRPLTPETVFPAAAHKVWWRCPHGHQWEATINSRSHLGTGCPYCSGRRVTKERSLASNFRGLARQWNKVKNGELTPQHVSSVSRRIVWWSCSNAHEWEAPVRDRTERGRGCPVCEATATGARHGGRNGGDCGDRNRGDRNCRGRRSSSTSR